MAEASCEQKGCSDGGKLRRGLCGRHYYLAKKAGNLPPRKNLKRQETCTIEGCGRPWSCAGLCTHHYSRRERFGSPTAGPPPRPRNAAGAEHPQWKGDEIGYQAWHVRLRKKPHGDVCQLCEVAVPTEWAFNWKETPESKWKSDETMKHPYTTDERDYLDVCVSCHRKFDSERRRVSRRGIGAASNSCVC